MLLASHAGAALEWGGDVGWSRGWGGALFASFPLLQAQARGGLFRSSLGGRSPPGPIEGSH